MKTLATLALAALAFGSVSAQEKEAKLKVLSDIAKRANKWKGTVAAHETKVFVLR